MAYICSMVRIGELNTLRIVKTVDFGLYLDGGTDGEILLPKRYMPTSFEIDDEIEVFIYLDSEDRLIATNETPLAMVKDLVVLEVVAIASFGAFLDWGLPKDLLLPLKLQKGELQVGNKVLVYIYVDLDSKRIVATQKIEKFLLQSPIEYEIGEPVTAIIYEKTPLGYKAVINKDHIGLIYKNEVFTNISIGATVQAFIKELRDEDKIDLTLNKDLLEAQSDIEIRILNKLNQNDGFLPIGDHSMPEIIYTEFGCSKKVFKKTIGLMFKNRKITIMTNGIKLNQKTNI